MSTAASPIRNIKSRLPTSKSISNMTTNGNEPKSTRIYFKKPLSATNILQNYSTTNGRNNHFKKQTVLLNNCHQNKMTQSTSINEKPNNNHCQQNGHSSNKQSSNNRSHLPSQSTVLYAIAPAPSSEEYNNLTKETNEEKEVSF
jgi:hypothetical protein